MLFTLRLATVAALVCGLSVRVVASPAPVGPTYGVCPHDFGRQMPAGEYCVYRGVMSSPGGAVCKRNAVVVWSTHGQEGPGDDAVVDSSPPARPEVFFGLVDAPALVLRAVADRRTEARMLDFSPSPEHAAVPVSGVATLSRHPPYWGRLALTLQPPLAVEVGPDDCAFGTYRGLYIGLMRAPDADAGEPAPPRPRAPEGEIELLHDAPAGGSPRRIDPS